MLILKIVDSPKDFKTIKRKKKNSNIGFKSFPLDLTETVTFEL